MRLIGLTVLGLLLNAPVFAQRMVGVKAGLITSTEGSVFLENTPLKSSSDLPRTVAEGQRLQTKSGPVEMQLGLGSVVRMGGNAALRLMDSSLEQVVLQAKAGSGARGAILDCARKAKAGGQFEDARAAAAKRPIAAAHSPAIGRSTEDTGSPRERRRPAGFSRIIFAGGTPALPGGNLGISHFYGVWYHWAFILKEASQL